MKMKKLICLLMALVIFILPITSYAAFITKSKTEYVPLLQSGDFDIEYSDKDYEYQGNSIVSTFTANNYDTAMVYIYNKLLNVEDRINVSSYNIPVDDFTSVFCEVVNDNPDLFYVSSNLQFTYSRINNTVVNIIPCYSMTADEINDAKIVFNNGVQKALACIDDSMTDLQKALVLHDYICDNANYIENGNISHSAYGFFYNGEIVCAGYTLAYSYLLNQLDIATAHMTSLPMAHAWNKVCIDNEWYNCDLTWDDLNFYDDESASLINQYGSFEHNSFMKSDAFFATLEGKYHFGGETYDDIISNDTTYDNYFWDNVTSKIIVKDGCYYYIESAGSGLYLLRRDANDNVTNFSNTRFYAPKLMVTEHYTDEDGNDHAVTVDDYLYRLEYLDNRFYVSSEKAKISSVSPDGTVRQITSNRNDYIIGMTVINNELAVQLYTNPTRTIIYDKLECFSNFISKATNSLYNNYPDINNDGYVNAKDYDLIRRQKTE